MFEFMFNDTMIWFWFVPGVITFYSIVVWSSVPFGEWNLWIFSIVIIVSIVYPLPWLLRIAATCTDYAESKGIW